MFDSREYNIIRVQDHFSLSSLLLLWTSRCTAEACEDMCRSKSNLRVYVPHMLQRKQEKAQVFTPRYQNPICRAVDLHALPCPKTTCCIQVIWFCFVLVWSLWFSTHYRYRPFHSLGILLYTETNIFICFFVKILTVQTGHSYLCAGQPQDA